MFAQISCLVLCVMVAGSLGAPRPDKYVIGFTHGTSARTNVNFGGGGKVEVDNGLAKASGAGMLGGSASGDVGGSVFFQKNNETREIDGQYHGVAGGWIKPSGSGQVGKTQDGYVINGNGKSRSYGEADGAGEIGYKTNNDALVRYNENLHRTADDIFEGEDNKFY